MPDNPVPRAAGGGHLVAVRVHHHRVLHRQPGRIPHRLQARGPRRQPGRPEQPVQDTVDIISSSYNHTHQCWDRFAPINGTDAAKYFERMAYIEERFYEYDNDYQ